MYRFLAIALLLAGCANSPNRPATWTTPEGDGWVITYRSSPTSGSTHLYINGKLVASGSFGVGVGNSATGSGSYGGRQVFFSCQSRYTPRCFVYADGKEIAELALDPQPPASLPSRPEQATR